MLMILCISGFIAVLLAAYLAYQWRAQKTSEARLLKARLEEFEEIQRTHRAEELSLLVDDAASRIPAFNRLLARMPSTAMLKRLIEQAGMRVRPGVLLLTCALAGAVAAALVVMATDSAALAVLLFPIGAAVPVLFVRRRRGQRFREFEEKFPNVVEFLARALRAGHPFSACLEMIGREMPEPVAGEFLKLYEQQRYGLPMRDALLALTERVPLVDVRFFVTAVLLQRETGGNLGEILDKLSTVIRGRFKIMRQVQVFTAQGRMSMIFLMLLPPGVALITFALNHEFMMPMFTETLGHLLLAGAVTSQVVGYFVIRKITTIKV